MQYQPGDRISITRNIDGYPAGSCGVINRRNTNGTYNVTIDRKPPQGCELYSVPVTFPEIANNDLGRCRCP